MPPKKLKYGNEKKLLPTERVEKLDVVENKSSPEVTFPTLQAYPEQQQLWNGQMLLTKKKSTNTLKIHLLFLLTSPNWHKERKRNV